MTGPLAIGIGCRSGCPPEAIVALVVRARATINPEQAHGDVTLFSLCDKRDEPGIRQAAGTLRLPLIFLPREALQGAMPAVATRSAVAEARFGVASVAEAAALAGAGVGARLLVRRLTDGIATCAIAVGGGTP